MTRMQDVTFYVQIEPTWSHYLNNDGERVITGLRLVGSTVRKPTKPKGGTALAKLTLRIPEAAFLPLRPEAIIVVPEDMVVTTPIEVEAKAPEET